MAADGEWEVLRGRAAAGRTSRGSCSGGCAPREAEEAEGRVLWEDGAEARRRTAAHLERSAGALPDGVRVRACPRSPPWCRRPRTVRNHGPGERLPGSPRGGGARPRPDRPAYGAPIPGGSPSIAAASASPTLSAAASASLSATCA